MARGCAGLIDEGVERGPWQRSRVHGRMTGWKRGRGQRRIAQHDGVVLSRDARVLANRWRMRELRALLGVAERWVVYAIPAHAGTSACASRRL